MTGGDGNDIFNYDNVAQSTTAAGDGIADFQLSFTARDGHVTTAADFTL